MDDGRGGVEAPSGPDPMVLELQSLFRETVALFHCLQATAAATHQDRRLTAGMRGVLLGLVAGGPQTVPQMARRRPTSRQHIQALVNRLRELGLVRLEGNPDHRRSWLVQLTAEGERAVAAIQARETRLLGQLDITLTGTDVAAASATLRTVRSALTGGRLPSRVRRRDEKEEEAGDA